MKILIVDDSKAMRMIVKRTLRQVGLGDHEMEEAGDGTEALPLIDSFGPDLVLSDWNMPEMLGIDLLRHVRASGNPVRFGFVTSEGTDDMRQLAKDEGADFLIAKPFDADVFAAVLERSV